MSKTIADPNTPENERFKLILRAARLLGALREEAKEALLKLANKLNVSPETESKPLAQNQQLEPNAQNAETLEQPELDLLTKWYEAAKAFVRKAVDELKTVAKTTLSSAVDRGNVTQETAAVVTDLLDEVYTDDLIESSVVKASQEHKPADLSGLDDDILKHAQQADEACRKTYSNKDSSHSERALHQTKLDVLIRFNKLLRENRYQSRVNKNELRSSTIDALAYVLKESHAHKADSFNQLLQNINGINVRPGYYPAGSSHSVFNNPRPQPGSNNRYAEEFFKSFNNSF